MVNRMIKLFLTPIHKESASFYDDLFEKVSKKCENSNVTCKFDGTSFMFSPNTDFVFIGNGIDNSLSIEAESFNVSNYLKKEFDIDFDLSNDDRFYIKDGTKTMYMDVCDGRIEKRRSL